MELRVCEYISQFTTCIDLHSQLLSSILEQFLSPSWTLQSYHYGNWPSSNGRRTNKGRSKLLLSLLNGTYDLDSTGHHGQGEEYLGRL